MFQSLSQADIVSLNDHVARFSEGAIAPKFSQPETLISSDNIEQLINSAFEQGLISAECSEGMGLWVTTEDPLQIQFSCQALRKIASINPGIAYQFHQLALSFYLLRELKKTGAMDIVLGGEEQPAVSLQGHFGLARYSLARFLKGATNSEDYDLLSDYFGHGASQQSTLFAHRSWTHLLTPVVVGDHSSDATIQFEWLDRANLIHCTEGHGHGLNELGHYLWHRPSNQTSSNSEAMQCSTLSPAQSRSLYSRALQIQWMGLSNIALGTLEHAYTLANDYSALRVQGGCTINQHAAVRNLLMDAKSAYSTTHSLIELACQFPINESSLADISNIRMKAHPMICQGANQALQVFGGMGYMQDAGLEKVVRDCTQLRLMNGTPMELSLFISELEQCR